MSPFLLYILFYMFYALLFPVDPTVTDEVTVFLAVKEACLLAPSQSHFHPSTLVQTSKQASKKANINQSINQKRSYSSCRGCRC
ncbi:hypothetical protein M430DRAFT_201591 [Amorphotheca resinae ATCC 22711]|uniref:Secreted protein n=1 Tax=Amorphotheca resinae ATCC 22711 TaxID=857342 RepID=A0A2T3BAS8_AMORE|nr:hypothetical protein M430DRAFT_201591 [Amorphotheca resinae ATCC 22711]PSS25390.1 hypothetical protein M430DRAFT_201591 [Amorphotheca resinae ATCC 22711]